MVPPLVQPTPRGISLKSSAPVGLLSTFAEEQWTNAANLARQRYRTTKDDYYLAVEIAAKSQSDNVADRNAGKVMVETMIKDNVTILDPDTIDMYEFACSRVDINYSETIGVLRAKLVKALSKDPKAGIRCFDACVWNSDWKNAQQIAASLNKNFASDRRFLFRYILATFQYSLAENCPDNSKKIFASLAKAQADKALDYRPTKNGTESRVDRTAFKESEVGLWLSIRIALCSPEENFDLFRKPGFGPIDFLEIGQMQPYWTVVNYLNKQQASEDMLRFGKCLLEEAIRITQSEASIIEKDEQVIKLQKLADAEARQTPPGTDSSVKKDLKLAIEKARPQRTTRDHTLIGASCEYALLSALFMAARAQPDKKRALKQLRHLIERTSKALTRAGCMKAIFQRTHEVLNLAILVERDESAAIDLSGYTTRVIGMANHIAERYKDAGSLTEVMVFVKDFNQPEVAALLSLIRTKGIKSADPFQKFVLISLALRTRYAMAMADKNAKCRVCDVSLEDLECTFCLQSIAVGALEAYKSGIEDKDLRENGIPGQDVNPLSDLAIIGSISLLRLSGLGRSSSPACTNSLYRANIQLFLQAVLWLDTCLKMSPPSHHSHEVILTKLYLLMGCVSRAKTIWSQFDVKNALLDSLGLLFLDRLSSVAPGLFTTGSNRNSPVEPFMVHFTRGLMTTTPKRIMDSLDMGNYSSVQDIIYHAGRQAASLSMVLAVVEERRGQRLKFGKIDAPIEDQPLVRNITIRHALYDTTDYEFFTVPNGENAKSFPGDESSLQSIVNYGALPTTIRGHLGLLAERFLDLVCYVQPKEYKPSKAGHILQLDWEYALSTSSNLERDMYTILRGRQETIKVSLTSAEYWYYTAMWKLATVVKGVLKHNIMSASDGPNREQTRILIQLALEALEEQTKDFLVVPENLHSKVYAFHGFASLHAMGMLRETILAVKHTANYLTLASDKAKNSDKTRSSVDLAWLAPELKKMIAAAAESENTIKARVKLLRAYLDKVDGWRDRLCDWVFGDYYVTPYDQNADFKKEVTKNLKAAIPKANAELWADSIGESWRELMKGWVTVKFE
ncbi:N-acetyltransferase B complex non catalytic subunit-domain-containing protein [Hypoxylon trugodes]|uniref:N-acetyltransferase B complex non catalytic subunit-domain-containing protein n=1 Tax=Hypoxylon trugodes TaxID=326681 RepID=UPI00219566B3|nr:N-acetyltransferase B complex non catalytic subunit-domain-containing protein [Hypoxylon trugodes]KAI1390382.1 N-acetyltransferase B complex non catalytic subunit-domain-containing protein [Hypoxylon trugodes]